MWKSSKHHSFVLIYFMNIVQNGTIRKCSNFEQSDFRIKFCISLRLDRSKPMLNKNMKCQRRWITSSQWSHLHNFQSKLTTKNVICGFYPQIQYFYGFNGNIWKLNLYISVMTCNMNTEWIHMDHCVASFNNTNVFSIWQNSIKMKKTEICSFFETEYWEGQN